MKHQLSSDGSQDLWLSVCRKLAKAERLLTWSSFHTHLSLWLSSVFSGTDLSLQLYGRIADRDKSQEAQAVWLQNL